MITAVNANTKEVTVGTTMEPMWKFWRRPDALQLIDRALEQQNLVPNLAVLEEARFDSYKERKRYADWFIDFDKFSEGTWDLDITSDPRWPRLVNMGEVETMSWEDFQLSVPGKEAIVKRLENKAVTKDGVILDASAHTFYKDFISLRPLRSTLSKTQEDYNVLAEEYMTTPKKLRGNIVGRMLACQYVQSLDIPSISDDPLEELRHRLIEK